MEVYGVDVEKGMLSMKLSEEFQKAGGATETVSCERTVLLDRSDESGREPEETQYCVRFFVSEDLYKACRVQEGDTIAAPVSPSDTESSFAAWEDVNGYLADFSEPVLCDRDYFATWE
jgi:hypothetical protein